MNAPDPKIMHEPSQDSLDNNHPVSKSEGPYNAYYLKGCPVAQRAPSYTSCLYKINKTQAGESHWAPECAEAITCKTCPALAMREQEQLAGKALFFQQARVHKGHLITNLTPLGSLPTSTPGAHIAVDPRAANAAGRYEHYIAPRKPAEPAPARSARPAPAAKPAPLVDSGSFADAISNAMKDESVLTPSAVPAPAIAVPANPVSEKTLATPASQPSGQAAAAVSTKITMQPGESPLAYARRVQAAHQAQ